MTVTLGYRPSVVAGVKQPQGQPSAKMHGRLHVRSFV